MYRIAVVFLLFLASSAAFALSAKEDGHAWHRASRGEKEALVKDAMRRIGAKYPFVEMMACVDTAFAKPAPEYVLGQQIATVMAFCHLQLE